MHKLGRKELKMNVAVKTLNKGCISYPFLEYHGIHATSITTIKKFTCSVFAVCVRTGIELCCICNFSYVIYDYIVRTVYTHTINSAHLKQPEM